MTLAACLTIWQTSWTPCWSNHGNLSPGAILHWKQTAQWRALSSEALIVCFHPSFSLSCSRSSHPSCPPSVRQSNPGAEIPLVSSFLSSLRHQRRWWAETAAERPEKKNERERETRKESFYVRGRTNLLRKLRNYYKMEETAVTHGSFSRFPMEAKIHKLMLIEQTTV